MGYTNIIVISFLLIYIIYKDISHYRERKNLLDRIMSRDYGQYVNSHKKTSLSKDTHSYVKNENMQEFKDNGFVK